MIAARRSRTVRVRLAVVLACAVVVVAGCGGSTDSGSASLATDDESIGAPLQFDSSGTGPGSLVSATDMPLLDRRVTSLASLSARVQYRSTSGIDDSESTVSGSVFVPSGAAPEGGWPVVAFGHGTTGVLGECGPSLDPTLLGVSVVVTALLRIGYAVTVPDYQGLGIPGGTDPTHPYLDATTEGMNLIDSVRAARRLSSMVSNRWVGFGISQGGQAVWAANVLARSYGSDLSLKGTASVSPIADLRPLADSAADESLSEDQYGSIQWLLLALKHENPGLDLDDFRRGVVTSKWDILSQCSPQYAQERTIAVKAITPDDLRPASDSATATLREYFAKRSVPEVRASAPMLVQYGDKDVLARPEWTTGAIARACRIGDNIEADLQSGKGHADVDSSTALSWLRSRFEDGPTRSTCGSVAR
ncbi:lipase family protein [Williamsia sp.]|uniref:lipase family protein n=1 Tax=Williamsia sp. TaxID=1872085 RepID=UPI001A249888|nr:lipase family protein [Williamsia sp.]MBJ7289147.1 lipase [Williamsia sp.]